MSVSMGLLYIGFYDLRTGLDARDWTTWEDIPFMIVVLGVTSDGYRFDCTVE